MVQIARAMAFREKIANGASACALPTMTGRFETADDSTTRLTTDGEPATPAIALLSTLVRYEGSADRRTIYPADVPDHVRTTHWLTADADAFRRLDEMR